MFNMYKGLKTVFFIAVLGVTLSLVALKDTPLLVVKAGIVGTINGKTIYNFTNEITEDGYQDLIDLLNGAKNGDSIQMNINSPGGSLTRTLQIEAAMQNTRASIACTVTGYAASGAASVLLNCGKITLNEKSIILFHLPYIGEDDEYKTRSALTNEGFYDYMVANYNLKEFLGEQGNKKFMLGFDVIITKQYFEQNKDKLSRPRFGFNVQGHN